MKPIKLKIKGLNSFIEEQTIDFNKLTDRGFFGIFGPTGSGKSTILDGITLALYGEVARKSSNYININCESTNVSFEFQISGSNPKRYLVQREFKVDKKTGNPRSGKCKVIDITNENLEILAESVSGVTAKCKDIIGLNLDDFTRTVVLPQGRFSEFLKLEGKSRRDMLERLFNLQQYGDNLARKLSNEIYKERTESSVLSGELKGYEDLSDEKLKIKEEEYEQITKKLKDVTLEVAKLEKEFNESKEIWNLQIEINDYRKNEEELKSKEKYIEEVKANIKLAESSEKLRPYINVYEETIKNIEDSEKEKTILMEKLQVIKVAKEKVEEAWRLAKDKKENELPNIKLKEQKLKDALEEKKLLDNLQVQINEVKNNIVKLDGKRIKEENKILELDAKIQDKNNEIKISEEKIESLKINSIFKQKVQIGLRLSEKCNDRANQVKNIKGRIESIEETIESNRIKEKSLSDDYNKKLKAFEEKEKSLEELIKNCPGNNDDLLAIQKQLSQTTEIWNKYNAVIKEIEDSKKLIGEYTLQLNEENNNKLNLQNNIEVLKIKIKELEVETLAYKIRESLSDGDICPVCGSLEHHKENIKHIELIDHKKIEKDILIKEKELKAIETKITTYKTKTTMLNEKITSSEYEINKLGEDFKNISIDSLSERFKSLQKALKEYNKQKENLEKEINILKDEKFSLKENVNNLKTIILENEKKLVELNDDYNKNYKSLQEVNEEYKSLSNEIGVTNFKQKNDEILEMEKDSEALSKKVKILRQNLEEFNKVNIETKNSLIISKEELTKFKTILEEKEKNKDEKITSIKNKVDDIDTIEEILISIKDNIKEIENKFINSESHKEEIDKEHREYNEKLVAVMGKVNELFNRRALDKETLDRNLQDEGIISIEDAKKNFINRNELNKLKEVIERYNEELSKTKGAIESVLKKLNNRVIDKDQWISIQENKKEKEEEKTKLNEANIKVEEEVRVIKQKLIELKELLKHKEKLDHKLGLLSNLEKLFKGKKFVEFVAATRLKYVSVEASKRLKEITNGNYGLEADENGRFIIRDYKNGGAARDASTLSGGETFLASLALALALSAEIQLKGTAPLELFFLDEGFGTLDDNLLEVVMDSLEKIHNDKMKIGLISHVESIKNRVPVKLILTPAESGRGGSKVRIERT